MIHNVTSDSSKMIHRNNQAIKDLKTIKKFCDVSFVAILHLICHNFASHGHEM